MFNMILPTVVGSGSRVMQNGPSSRGGGSPPRLDRESPTLPAGLAQWRRAVPAIAIVAFSAGCGLFSGDCTSEARPGLIIRVIDKNTGTTPSIGSRVTITEGGWSEIRPPAEFPVMVVSEYTAAYERPGTYSILIRTGGYQDWRRDGVTVETGGGCAHVNSVRLTVELVALGNNTTD